MPGEALGGAASLPVTAFAVRSHLPSSTVLFEMKDAIRDILRQHARLPDVDGLTDETDLYAAGLTSHATVNLMVALEDRFGIEFPERMLRRRSFESIAAISAAIAEITAAGG
jgi:acyl carrier protein